MSRSATSKGSRSKSSTKIASIHHDNQSIGKQRSNKDNYQSIQRMASNFNQSIFTNNQQQSQMLHQNQSQATVGNITTITAGIANSNVELCPFHNYPLSYMCKDCNDTFICELCGVEGDHKYHELTNLRPIIIDMMKRFDDNFKIFEEQFIKVKEARVSEYRNKVYQEVDDFFVKINEICEQMHQQKRAEVDEIFRKLKIEDLSDLQKYSDLYANVAKALTDMQNHYKELSFSKIYTNRESIKKIDKAIVDISVHLKQAHQIYENKWRQLFKIQRNDQVIENVIRQFVEANFKTLGTLANPQRVLDPEMDKKCDGVKFDIEVIELINVNNEYMKPEEQKIVLNSLKGMYEGTKSLILNYGQITDYGAEILSEALKFNTSVHKLDLNTNKISDLGLMKISESLQLNKNLDNLRLSFNRIKDKGCEYLYEGLKDNKTLTTLYLDNNQLGNEGARNISKLLTVNQGITHLYLEGNSIEDEGAEFIAQGLRRNKALQYIYLNNNRIGNNGAYKIANELINSNQTIKGVIMFNNLIGESQKEEQKRMCGNRLCLFNPLS